MKQIFLLAVTCVAMVLYAASQSTADAGVSPMSYELYSWQGSNGSWNFCVLASPSGVNISAEQVFNKKFLLSGVKELKRKISELPVGATIIWPDRILLSTGQKAKESEKLSYPPSETLQDIRHYAEARKIKVDVLSAQQKQE
jgi:hypothetical protein